MTEREQITEEVRNQLIQEMMANFNHEKERKLANFRSQNAYVQKGQILFTGSSLMEQFPVAEFCLNEGLPIVYNRGIGGYTTDEFLTAIGPMLLDLEPSRLFINIGTNDIREMPEGEDWFSHLSVNYRKICEIIREKLPETIVYMMAYYPVNPHRNSPGLRVRTNEAIVRANEMVSSLASEFGFRYIDVNDGLKDEQGNLQIEHTQDGIHFDAAAYRTVFERLKQYL
uniref:Lysophospholipase L1 and related esterases n=1 Tax=uncultured bacterium Contig140 TaxID=1393424 RepID=W0FLV3_9BACT|nr:lysophospholipase L1 and related esterases [uncultured bacterium Contig140]